jgi:hypothetical protein
MTAGISEARDVGVLGFLGDGREWYMDRPYAFIWWMGWKVDVVRC